MFEQDIKQKMEQRTIQPTEMAWDRLDAMLSVAEEGKKKPSRTWMYMAASFLALLLVGALFLSQQKQGVNSTVTNGNSVVTTNSEPSKLQETVKNAAKSAPQAANPIQAVATTIKVPAAKIKPALINKAGTPVSNSNDVAPLYQEPNVNQVAVTVTDKSLQSAKIKVDAKELLASVDKPEINSPKIKQSSVKVDANSLLSSVEGELNESYRTGVFQGVVKNFNVVKSAVANRNHQ